MRHLRERKQRRMREKFIDTFKDKISYHADKYGTFPSLVMYGNDDKEGELVPPLISSLFTANTDLFFMMLRKFFETHNINPKIVLLMFDMSLIYPDAKFIVMDVYRDGKSGLVLLYDMERKQWEEMPLESVAELGINKGFDLFAKIEPIVFNKDDVPKID